MSEWISVDKGIPGIAVPVLACGTLVTELGMTFLTWVVYHDGIRWREFSPSREPQDGWSITHWMPLPEPPND